MLLNSLLSQTICFLGRKKNPFIELNSILQYPACIFKYADEQSWYISAQVACLHGGLVAVVIGFFHFVAPDKRLSLWERKRTPPAFHRRPRHFRWTFCKLDSNDNAQRHDYSTKSCEQQPGPHALQVIQVGTHGFCKPLV